MAHAHDDVPGELPKIRDEAADTPMWVPAVGLALLILGALFIVYRAATDDELVEEATTEEAAAEEAAADEGDGEGDGEAEAADEVVVH